MNWLRCISPIRSIRFRWYRLLGWLRLSCSGVRRGAAVCAYGMPIISLHPGSKCSIGQGTTLISASFATALGVTHPVVLRTLRPNAAIRIGAHVGISGGSICAATLVSIGENTMLGANVTIADTDFHSLDPGKRFDKSTDDPGGSPVIIGRHVFIGTNVIILKGVRIGDNSVIGAGSVVTKDVPPNVIAAGNPCRPIRSLPGPEAHR